jgi:hypothetical protein
MPTPALAQLNEPTSAFGRAHHLHETVARRLREVDERTEKHGLRAARPQAKPVASRPWPVYGLRHNRQAARQAFVASLVFGPPKSLED